MAYRTYAPANGFIVDPTGSGDFTTIQAAITAAVSGQTIFLKDGTYTENPTLKAGVDLCSFISDAFEPNVDIVGTCTFTGAGSVSLSGIRLQTNSAAILAVTGSAASVVNLNDCYLNCTNNTGITFSSSSGSAAINIINCQGDLGTTGIALFTHSSAGNLNINYTRITNTGGSSTANTPSAGSCNFRYCIFNNPITTSGTTSLFMNSVTIDTVSINSICLTHGSTTRGDLNVGQLLSGSASALSISNLCTFSLENVSVNSTNTNAITGSGTLLEGPITFLGTSSTINTTTITPLITDIGTLNLNTALTVPNGGTGLQSAAAYSLICGGTTTTGAFQTVADVATGSVLVSGGTTALPAFSAAPTVTSITFGAGNALNKYVNGTFTPTVSLATPGTSSFTYSTQTGEYTQIGNIVFVTINITLTNFTIGTGSGNVQIGALPVANGTLECDFSARMQNVTFGTLVNYYVGRVSNGATIITLPGTVSASSTVTLQAAGLSSTSSFDVTGFYFTS